MKFETKRVNFFVEEVDFIFFDYLHSVKVATKKQITRDVYESLSDRTISLRLHKFIRGSLICCELSSKLKGHFIYSLTPFGYKKLIESKGIKRGQLKSDKIYHDLLLVDIRNIFQSSDNILNYYTENDLQVEFRDSETNNFLNAFALTHSDGCIQLHPKENNFYMGIELELSKKSDSRYRETLGQFYSTEDSDIILYITKNCSIADKIKNVDKHFFTTFEAKIYYTTLDSFFVEKSLVFTNRENKKIDLSQK
jgi:hypothetical protein